MLFTAEHEEPRRTLQKFIATEINRMSTNGRRPGGFPRTSCSRSSASSVFSG